MPKVNKTTIITSVAIVAGLFVYKQFVEKHVNKAVSGGAQ